jgi:hypothetical protein
LHDTFENEFACMLEYHRAVVLDVVIEPNAMANPGQKVGGSFFADLQRIATEIVLQLGSDRVVRSQADRETRPQRQHDEMEGTVNGDCPRSDSRLHNRCDLICHDLPKVL